MEVILVDDKDIEIGRCEKLKAHKDGLLHRAFSVFIFNKNKELLIQKRALDKYHSGGLWSNTCCSHPTNGDILIDAKKRLNEEMGIECELKELFRLIYSARVGELIENEFDHVFIGIFDGNPNPDKKEVMDWRWIHQVELKREMNTYPMKFTPWLKLAIDEVTNFN